MRRVTNLELAMICIICVMGVALTLTGCEPVDKWTGNTTTTTIPPDSTGDSIPIASVTWLGLNYGGAKIDAKLTGATMTSRHLTLNDPAPSDWVLAGQPPNQVQGRVFLFYLRDGKMVGGYFEQLRPGQTVKMMHNVHQGKNGLHFPPAGVTCYTMTGSMDGRLRSNIVTVHRNGR
jgi:hypothetical protein